MEKINDGGAAFPQDTGKGYRAIGDKLVPVDGYVQGLTIRDWFAGQALQGLCALSSDPIIKAIGEEAVELGEKTQAVTFARLSYECADAMLREREKGK